MKDILKKLASAKIHLDAAEQEISALNDEEIEPLSSIATQIREREEQLRKCRTLLGQKKNRYFYLLSRCIFATPENRGTLKIGKYSINMLGGSVSTKKYEFVDPEKLDHEVFTFLAEEMIKMIEEFGKTLAQRYQDEQSNLDESIKVVRDIHQRIRDLCEAVKVDPLVC